jgi:hypothetical protein
MTMAIHGINSVYGIMMTSNQTIAFELKDRNRQHSEQSPVEPWNRLARRAFINTPQHLRPEIALKLRACRMKRLFQKYFNPCIAS